MTQRLL